LRFPGRQIALPPSAPLLGALVLAYAVLGLLGHDPWKSEDAIGIGIVHQMLVHGQWAIPHVAGEPYFEDGPLFYWLAALTAKLTSAVLPEHDGARLASGVAIAATAWLTYLTGRALYEKTAGTGSVLVLLGCLGLLVHAHETLAETGMLATQALALYAIAIAPRAAARGAICLGAGIAGAILCKGPAAGAMPVAAALLAPLLSSGWRNGRYATALGGGLFAAALLVGAWVIWVESEHPTLTAALFRLHLAQFAIPTPAMLSAYLQILAWASWPAWPIACWTLWEARRRPADGGTRILVAAVIVALVVLFAQWDVHDVNAMSVFLPLALLAGPGTVALRRGAANALAWFGALSAILFGFLLWLGWFAMMTGFPERIARNFTRLEPGYAPHFAWLPLIAALALTSVWIWLLARSEHSVFRSVTYWCAGLTLIWGLAMTLWLSWIDYGKSYRPVALGLQRALPRNARCVESRGLGEPQRAAFDYHADIVTVRLERRPKADCPFLLVQSREGASDPAPEGWVRIWEGNRPHDRERYVLYRRK
jgi:4-amino-4-deoxy-L-arabinose transferase-like glycosyltransferase